MLGCRRTKELAADAVKRIAGKFMAGQGKDGDESIRPVKVSWSEPTFVGACAPGLVWAPVVAINFDSQFHRW